MAPLEQHLCLPDWFNAPHNLKPEVRANAALIAVF